MLEHTPLTSEAMPGMLWLFDLAVCADLDMSLVVNSFKQVQELLVGLAIG